MSTPAATSSPAAAPGPWSPLGQPTFRSLWLAVLFANIGTWIHDVAAVWVIAEETNSPLMVAAVQTATTLPMVGLAIVAGTLSDIVDRRRYLIIAQLWMMAVATTLAVLAYQDALGPWTLIAMTFALGVGAAMAMPAQQATTPELVPKPMLAPAVALGSLSMNIARAIGPALGGLLVAQVSVAWAFAVNALTFGVLAVVLWRWKRIPTASVLPPETFGVALRAGLRYATHASVLQAVLFKAALFFSSASALTALLPILVKKELGASAGTFGLVLACIGIGAIAGAMVLPKIRARSNPDRMVLIATVSYALCMATMAASGSTTVLYVGGLAAGFAWITVLSSLQIAAQTSVPAWVRARALSLYIVVFSGGMAVGSLGWGWLAQHTGTSRAILWAALGTAIAAVVSRRFHLAAAAHTNVTPSGHWAPPPVPEDGSDDRGPVLITIEYRVGVSRREEFLQRLRPLGEARRRNGALQWGVAEDSAQPGVYLEYFVDASWREHLRQHERVTEDERLLQDAILDTLIDRTQPPRIRHFIGGAPALAPSNAPSTGHLS